MKKVYSKMKIFSYPDKVASLTRENPQILSPLHIRIKPTNACAHDCWYCAYRSSNYQLGEEMSKRDHIPKEKMLEIVRDMSKIGVKAVTFSGGGDPFYYPYLGETLKALVGEKIKFAALTNGAKLSGDLAELFAKYGSWVRISIDGWDDESYAKYRQIKVGEYSKVINNLKNFKKLKGDCILGVSFIIDKDNAAHVYDQLKLFHEIGVNSVKVSACITSDDPVECNQYHAPFFEEVKKQIADAKEKFQSDTFEIQDSYYEMSHRFLKDYDWCPYLQVVPVIGADLNIYSCHDKAYTKMGILGSIKDQNFDDFWMNDKSKFFKIKPNVDCNHHCMVNYQNELLVEYLNINEVYKEFV